MPTDTRPGMVYVKPIASLKDRLLMGQSLLRGARITSANGEYFLAFQTDGNLVVYNRSGQAIWAPGPTSIPPVTNLAGRGGTKAIMQNDGNFVVYANETPLWQTQTVGRGGFIVIQNDGNLVIYSNSNSPVWQSYTAGGHYGAPTTSPFAIIASTLGGAAKSLANGVAVAAKWTGHAFTDVTSSPLWKIAAGVAPFVLPGIGLAVSAGMVTASAIGKAASVKDAIIGAARENMPGGVAGQAGFDVAIGVAVHGEGMTEASLNAVRNQVPDGPAKAGFDAALSLHAGRVLSPTTAPVTLTAQGKAAYYATQGLVKIKAPPAMKVAVSQMIVTNANAHRGLESAVNDIGGKDISWLEWIWHEVKNVGVKVHDTIIPRNPKTIVTVRGVRVQ